jgi:hypothetical protein
MLKGWKTLAFNIASAVFGVLESTDFTNVVPADYQGFVITAISVINIFLRMNTNTPIGRKD